MNMEVAFKRHLAVQGYIERFWTNLKKAGKEQLTTAYLEASLERLDSYWHQYEEGNNNLLGCEDDILVDYFAKDVFTSIEMVHRDVKAKIKTLLREKPPPAEQDSMAALVSTVQLPKINMPVFAGDPLSWEGFRDQFQAVVGNMRNLAPVQKLQYLRASLSGEAAAVVADMELTDEAYETAWKELQDLYDNPRVLMASHMRKFLNCPPVTTMSSADLKRLITTTTRAIRAFKSLKQPVEYWDAWFIHVTVEKLDSATRLLWEATLTNRREFPSFSQLYDHIQTRIRSLDAAGYGGVTATPSSKPSTRRRAVASLAATTTGDASSGKHCPGCRGDHLLGRCPAFRGLSVPLRREQVRRLKVCFNCLRSKHFVGNCPSSGRCSRCQKKHHSMLHTSVVQPEHNTSASKSLAEEVLIAAPVSSCVSSLVDATRRSVLLPTARAIFMNEKGDKVLVRTLLDTGSQISFLSERVVRALRLPRRRVHLPIAGIRECDAGVANQAVSVVLASPRDDDLRLHLPEVFVVSKVTSVLPSTYLYRTDWPHLHGLPLADPDFDRPEMVDAVLSSEVYSALLMEGVRKGPRGTPSAQATSLGWVLLGRGQTRDDIHWKSPTLSVNHVTIPDETLSQSLCRFWELEELPRKAILSDEDRYCEDLFRETHTRDVQGRYTVRLPRRRETEGKLANNKREALNMSYSLERRLERNPGLRGQYVQFMNDYLSLGHMEVIPASQQDSQGVYYLPHHAVFKHGDTHNQIRVVFNASSPTLTGLSLNGTLLTGPKLQSELWLILSRWRLFRFAFTSDIIKMFRQIRVEKEDTHLQRILWRPDATTDIKVFRLVTVVYGTASAPYLALRTLRQLAEDETFTYPIGATILREHSYVDDMLHGGHTLADALEAQRQLVAILKAGGFALSKWAANSPELCPDEDAASKLFCDRSGVSTLGVLWTPEDDRFALRVTPATAISSITKRAVLSAVARFFDPLGWAAPVLIFGKIYIQDLWMAGLNWDDPLPEDMSTRWRRFVEALPQLEDLRIPRWLGYQGTDRVIELHGFSDASSRAYAAAVYLRSVGETGQVTVSLLVVKTKVAPIKRVSIPRLELCGALLVARLLHVTAEGLGFPNIPILAWTDAAVVLSWIRSHPARWKPFVANRVSEIQDLVPPQAWRYVQSEHNPADAATRGITPGELSALDLWWSGPPWLRNLEYTWVEPGVSSDDSDQEAKRIVNVLTALPRQENPILNRFSSLSRLLRITALCCRFADHSRCLSPRRIGFITADELSTARIRWVRIAQQSEFQEEITLLSGSKPLPSSSPLRSLRPFLDDRGLLRVGGRLQHALLPYDEKHPLILARSSRLSLLLVREAHAASLHGGSQLTRSVLLRRYWIIKAGALVRSVIHGCVRCVRLRAVTAQQQMGNLPSDRVRPCRPFRAAGVDYAGPIWLRASKGRGRKVTKGYICLFICLSSKAVHLEAVSDLTSASFLAAFKRFISRRGHCRRLVSDNGTNLRGAAAELRSMFSAATAFYHQCASELANCETEWSFIPPGAPHFGGLWEAGIKSVKFHLRRVIGEHRLTYEEMATLLAQIEACLNSRPLYTLSNDPLDLTAITPGHLLIGEPLLGLPEPSLLEVDVSKLASRWALVTNMRDHFWKRWSTEYVHHLQQLSKWRQALPNLRVGALVLIKNELQPPTKWALARVIQLHPGSDGLVRVVSVRTATSVVKRPVTKLCLLPVETAKVSER